MGNRAAENVGEVKVYTKHPELTPASKRKAMRSLTATDRDQSSAAAAAAAVMKATTVSQPRVAAVPTRPTGRYQ